MDVPVLADQQELIYISFVLIQDVVWKICQDRDGWREKVRKIHAVSMTMMMIYGKEDLSARRCGCDSRTQVEELF